MDCVLHNIGKLTVWAGNEFTSTPVYRIVLDTFYQTVMSWNLSCGLGTRQSTFDG